MINSEFNYKDKCLIQSYSPRLKNLMKSNAHYLLENIPKLLRQRGWLSFEPGLIERTKGPVGKDVGDQVGCEDATTGGNQQWSTVLLKKHRVPEKV